MEATFEFNSRYYFTDFDKFSDFVIPFLSSQHSVQSLRLTCHCCSLFDEDDINHFLYQVALQGIHELHLRLFTYSTILPNGFCKNLVTLELHYASLNYVSCVDFPLLKLLNLIEARFESHAVMFKFLRGCPNLEYLDARHLTIGSRDIPPLAEEIAEALPKLVRAKINHSSILFPVLGNAQFLCIQTYLRDRVYIPKFHNLSHVEFTSPLEYIGCNFMWNWFARMLHNCPKLQNLTISKEHHTYAIGKCHWKDQQTVPECLSSQLRTFKFKSYNGFGCEVQFAKYIMQNSKVLQNMTIHTKAIDLKHQMLETFSLCPKGSAACNLQFETALPTL